MSRRLRLGSMALCAVLLAGCPSAPKPPEKAVPPSPPAEVPPAAPQTAAAGQEISPVTDQEVSDARKALARAKEADADYYDAGNFDVAGRLLDSALSARTIDPASAHQQLADARGKADLSFDNAVARGADELRTRMASLKQRLLELNADKYAREEFQSSTAGIQEASDLYANKSYSAARARAWQALHDMAALADRLEARLDVMKTARYDAEQAMKEAESVDAYSYAPAEKNNVTGMYLRGLQAQQEYLLDQAEESFGAAREAAQELLQKARAAREARAADEKQKAAEKQARVMRGLEEASRLLIVAPDGTVVQPRNWTDDDLQKEMEPSAADLLSQARQLWAGGVKENLAGNYGNAQGHFDEARRYTETYASYAVKGLYTVRLDPESRDTLWRIAGDKDVYGDPFQWPRIWRRNSKLIKDPDLIQPGWQLIIPR